MHASLSSLSGERSERIVVLRRRSPFVPADERAIGPRVALGLGDCARLQLWTRHPGRSAQGLQVQW